MLTIRITEDAENAPAMADVLEHIARQVREGHTSGYYPHWVLDGEPLRPSDEDEEDL